MCKMVLVLLYSPYNNVPKVDVYTYIYTWVYLCIPGGVTEGSQQLSHSGQSGQSQQVLQPGQSIYCKEGWNTLT